MPKFIVTVEVDITDEELANLGGGLERQLDKRLEDDRFSATVIKIQAEES